MARLELVLVAARTLSSTMHPPSRRSEGVGNVEDRLASYIGMFMTHPLILLSQASIRRVVQGLIRLGRVIQRFISVISLIADSALFADTVQCGHDRNSSTSQHSRDFVVHLTPRMLNYVATKCNFFSCSTFQCWPLGCCRLFDSLLLVQLSTRRRAVLYFRYRTDYAHAPV
jgi:hypothetical protein